MTETRKRINYTVACVSEFAGTYGITPKEAFEFLCEYKTIELLKEHYDIEHTLSFEDAVEDMMIICRNNEGELKTAQLKFENR